MKKTEKDVVDEIKEEKPTIKKRTKKENDIEVIKNKTEVEAKKKSKNNEEKVEEKVQENKDINPKESSEDSEKDKLLKIVNNAKAKGKITSFKEYNAVHIHRKMLKRMLSPIFGRELQIRLQKITLFRMCSCAFFACWICLIGFPMNMVLLRMN